MLKDAVVRGVNQCKAATGGDEAESEEPGTARPLRPDSGRNHDQR